MDTYQKLQPGDFYKAHVEKGLRPDGRGNLISFRPVSITANSIASADGSSIVKQGGTVVLCGVKLELAEPKSERPDEGYVVPNLELPSLCHSQFKPGPPPAMAQVASCFINEVIQNSGLINPKDLCVEAGKLVWVIYIDLTCLNLDGNILDVCIKSLVTALRTVRVPHVVIKKEEDEEEQISVDADKRSPLKLPESLPYCCTIAIFENDKLLVDPTEEEENYSMATITIVIQLSSKASSQPSICHMYKPGGVSISKETLQSCIGLAKKQAKQIKKLIDTASPVVMST